MGFNFNFQSQAALSLSLDFAGATDLADMLQSITGGGQLDIELTPAQTYRGKRIDLISILAVGNGEFVHRQKNCICLEVEFEMVAEWIGFLRRACLEYGFQTPEIITFAPKTKTDCSLTIYGDWISTELGTIPTSSKP
jgi:hypothetical protein